MADTLTLKIDSTAFGGKGVARLDGKVYFAQDAIEGDVIEAKVTQDEGRYSNVEIVKLIEPSPLRKALRCPYGNSCGGCQWQDIDYENQLAWKRSFVTSSLKRIGRLPEELVESLPIVSGNLLNGYRNRVLLRARLSSTGSLTVGYFKKSTRDFIAVTQCLIADPEIQDFLSWIQTQNLLTLLPNQSEIYEEIKASPHGEIKFRFEIQVVHDNKIVIGLYDPEGPQSQKILDVIMGAFRRYPSVVWCASIRDQPDTPYQLEEDLNLKFFTYPGQFQQVNLPLNRQLRRFVNDVIARKKPKTLLDVFCGSGNLSLAPAASGIQVTGIEFSRKAIEAAKHNCKINKIANAHYFSGDSEKFLWRASKAKESFDLVIVDPPREGMYKCIIPLTNLAPQTIIYVSCDPTTLARDLGSLTKRGYVIEEIKAIDFFPNTYHIESFVVLQREP